MIFGHQKEKAALHEALTNDALHHTLLFTGPEGIGKRGVGIALAETLFCQSERGEGLGGCSECHHCKLVASGNMPDLITINCEDKKSGSTESIKEVLKDLRLRPFSGNHRVVLLDNAHALHGQSANALLKSLEEPRPGTYFVLITHKPHLMLKTIHSRAQRWGFHTLSKEDLEKVIREKLNINIDSQLISLASGSVYNYSILIELKEELIELQSTLIAIQNGDKSQAMVLADSLSKRKDEFSTLITLIGLIGRKALYESRDEQSSLRWSCFLDELGKLPHLLLKRNFAPLYILQNLFLQLASDFPEQFVAESESSFTNLLPY